MMNHSFGTDLTGKLFSGRLGRSGLAARYPAVSKYVFLANEGEPLRGLDLYKAKNTQTKEDDMRLNIPEIPCLNVSHGQAHATLDWQFQRRAVHLENKLKATFEIMRK